ncbi:MAG: stalk domain-containing protein [Clostridia bacterium]|nr:stalk domain-containing protein [Clostridia bacterium]
MTFKYANYKKNILYLILILIFVTANLSVNFADAPKAVSISLSQNSYTLGIVEDLPGDSQIIDATAKYNDSTEEPVRLVAKWTSSNSNVVSVDAGLVEALSEGTATITAEYQGLKASATVKVVKATITGLNLSAKETVTLEKNIVSPLELRASSSLSTGSSMDITEAAEWTSSNPNVADAGNGFVTSVGEGTATITVKFKSFSDSMTVNVVNNKITGLTLSQTAVQTYIGVTAVAPATVTLENGTTSDVSRFAEWKSNNEKIAVVDEEGRIEGVGNGKAIITCTYKGFTAKVDVTVGITIILKINSPKMTYNGVVKEIDPGRGTAPVVISGRTLLPIRSLIEQLEGTVAWDSYLEKVTIELNEKKIELWIGERKALIDGNEAALDVAPQVINGRTMLPLRFISETLGYKVNWDNNTKQVTITD